MRWLTLIARAVVLAVVSPIARGAEPPAPPQPASPRVDDTIYTVLMASRPCGTQTIRKMANGEWRVVFEFNDRGRGPLLTQRTVLDAEGKPTLVEIEGHDYLKNPVRERFSIEQRKADWKSSAEQGSRALTGPAFYVSFHGVPIELGWLARALLAAPERKLALLPEGEARIERVETLAIPSKGQPRTVIHYEITGLGFTPSPIWLDEDGEFFAMGSEWSMTIRKGWEDAAQPLTSMQARRTRDHQRTLANALAHKPQGVLVITHARVFEPE